MRRPSLLAVDQTARYGPQDPGYMRSLPSTTTLRKVRRHVAPIGRYLLARLPQRFSRWVLTVLLRHLPEMWGWSLSSGRFRAASCAYRDAFPQADHQAFMNAFVAARASGLATSMAWMSRNDAGRASPLIDDYLSLAVPGDAPCLVTYLHYSIDPILPLALLAGNRQRRFRWVVLPPRPNTSPQWGKDERLLYLAGIDIPAPIASAILPVTTSDWLIKALRHLKTGGSVLIALDTALDARRTSIVQLTVGRAAMPISPAITFLADIPGIRLVFAWPERSSGDAWSLHYREFTNVADIASAASLWIDDHHLDWGGWHHLFARRRPIDIREPLAS